MDKLDMLETIDSLISCIRGNEQDIDTLVERQIECMPNDELEGYFRATQMDYYRDNPYDFRVDYYMEFVDY